MHCWLKTGQKKEIFYTKKNWGKGSNLCRCRISSDFQLGGSDTGHCDHLEYYYLSRPHTGLKLDCWGSSNHLAVGDSRKDNVGHNQDYTEPPGFEGVAGNSGGLVGLLCRGWTQVGRGSRPRCIQGSCQQGGRGGGDGLSASPRNVTVI